MQKWIIRSALVITAISIVGVARSLYVKRRSKRSFDVETLSRDIMTKFSELFPNSLSIPQPNRFVIIPSHQLFLSKNNNHFIHSTLRNSKSILELIFVYPTELDGDCPKSVIIFVKIGTSVDGYNGVVHGGFTAALCDDFFGALFFKSKQTNPSKHVANGVTANLNINYRRPLVPGKWIIWVGTVEKAVDRKTFLLCKIFNMDLQLLVEGSSLFITPK